MNPSQKLKILLSLFSLVVITAFHWVIGSPQQVPAGKPVVIKGATVIDGLGGPPLTNAAVVIEGEEIKSIRKGTDYPKEATVVDLAGKFIIPGLIESHVHWEPWMGEVYLNHGVTSIVAIGGDFGKEKAAAAGSLNSPRIFHTAGRPEIASSMTREQVRDAMGEYLKKKPDVASFSDFNHKIRPMYGWAAQEAHEAGLMIFGHTENAPESIEIGHDIIEHIWGFVQAQMSPQELEEFQKGKHLHWGTFFKDWVRLDQMIKEAVAREVAINPTLYFELGSLSPLAPKHELEAYALYSNPDLMAYFPHNIAASLLQKQRQIRNFSSRYDNLVLLSKLTPEDLEQFRDGYQKAKEFLKRFVRAGGKIHSGTDAPSGGTPGLSLHHEIELLVEAGLTPMEALKASTSWPAEMLAGKGGILGHKKVGSLREGNLADLVVLKANPLEDIANTKKIERVMKGGKFIDLGYHPAYFTFTRPPRKIAMATPVPEISAITPHTVVEGSPDFEMVVEGVGFVGTSVVRIEGISMPTQFVSARTLKVKAPAKFVERATPNPWGAPGPEQNIGIFGDRTISIQVYNPPPEGGISNSVSLRVRPKWMGK